MYLEKGEKILYPGKLIAQSVMFIFQKSPREYEFLKRSRDPEKLVSRSSAIRCNCLSSSKPLFHREREIPRLDWRMRYFIVPLLCLFSLQLRARTAIQNAWRAPICFHDSIFVRFRIIFASYGLCEWIFCRWVVVTKLRFVVIREQGFQWEIAVNWKNSPMMSILKRKYDANRNTLQRFWLAIYLKTK